MADRQIDVGNLGVYLDSPFTLAGIRSHTLLFALSNYKMSLKIIKLAAVFLVLRAAGRRLRPSFNPELQRSNYPI